MNKLSQLSTTESECSENIKRKSGEPCSSKKVINAIREFSNSDADTNAKTIQIAEQQLNCDSESCVLSHPEFRHFIASNNHTLPISIQSLNNEAISRFKTKGPRNSIQLLSNVNIDSVLREWAVVYPHFYNIPFTTIDFESVGGSLARIDVIYILEGRESQYLGTKEGVVMRKCSTFACILNTDVSTGRGKHWVAIFGDCRNKSGPWTIEYFNSAGNPILSPVTRWLERVVACLSQYRATHLHIFEPGIVTSVCLTDVRHQKSQTECGVYCLYYIRSRLEGIPYTEFQNIPIPDEVMIQFRKHLFST